jgi:hypothetical protein
MRTRLSITVVAVAIGLAIGAPSAFAEGRLAGSPGNDPVAFFHTNELQTAVESPLPFPDSVAYFRSNELASAAASTMVRSDYRDAHERGQAVQAAPDISATNPSGTDAVVDWGQISIGIGIGLVLSVGLLLTVRLRPSKSIAQ